MIDARRTPRDETRSRACDAVHTLEGCGLQVRPRRRRPSPAAYLTALLVAVTTACVGSAQQAPAGAADEAALRELEGYFDAEATAGRFSGAIGVAHDGTLLYRKAWGMADRAKGTPNDVETKFNLGSMNKMFTAVAIAQLVAEGKLRFDDPLAKFYPDFPTAEEARRIRIEHLLSHTSGLGSYFSSGPRPETIAGAIEAARDRRQLAFDPGKGWSYSNTGFLLLGGIIEQVTGRSYHDYVRERIYEPAGMWSTSAPAFGETVQKLALSYAPPGTLGPDTMVRPLYRGTSAGGGVSTVGDMLRFADALLKGKLVPLELVEMLTTAKPEIGSRRYGYGFSAAQPRDGAPRITGHNGGAPGIFANLDVYPETGYVAVLLMNNANGEVQQEYVAEMRRAVARMRS